MNTINRHTLNDTNTTSIKTIHSIKKSKHSHNIDNNKITGQLYILSKAHTEIWNLITRSHSSIYMTTTLIKDGTYKLEISY